MSLTCDEADGLLVVDAGQVSILGHTVVFSVLPRFNGFTLEVIAVISVEKISLITVRLWREKQRNQDNVGQDREG